MRIDKALTFVAGELNQKGIPWRLFASGALMVWGVKIEPEDIDIFVSKENVIKLEKTFEQFVANPTHPFTEEGREYLEFQMTVDGVKVEICELEDLRKLVTLNYLGEKISVASLQAELDYYKKHSKFGDRTPLIEKRLAKINGG
ncbi:hypothetical protein HYU91_00705 [Candidatus Collierbacteria bacterium]|nr:hypothetical protein [Candidatus Collierbacteria bacterium]